MAGPDWSSQLQKALQQFQTYLKSYSGITSDQDHDWATFAGRLKREFADFYLPLFQLYGHRRDFEQHFQHLGEQLWQGFCQRSAELKALDGQRELTSDWFERETMVGGIIYVDRWAGTLAGVQQHLPYLEELKLTYLHMMPLLKPRPGENDGGYAVMDYCSVDPRVGTMPELAALSGELRKRGISLCLDLVVNHTAKEHEWAQKAAAGDPYYLDFYFSYDSRALPDQYERTLPEVFPDFAPGNFTFYPQIGPGGKWIWTTFNEYQWDLNYTNPAVFNAMLDNMLYLSNQGVEVLRLDAVPFMWKRLGTSCQNQPEVHQLMQAYRAILKIAAPGVIFKAEAIVAPQELVNYLGSGVHYGKECELAYNNSLMVLVWDALASRKVDIMTYTLERMPSPPPRTGWITYVRCHDDIGWAINDEYAAAVGENGYWHRRFLTDFYAGDFPGSFARGAVFQRDPNTHEGRTSGQAASLAGAELAEQQHDPAALKIAVARIRLLYSVIFSYGGLPLIYMGDEIGQFNDMSYLADPTKADDNRWMHRPIMDWNLAEQRRDPNTLAGQVYTSMTQMLEVRRSLPHLHMSIQSVPRWTGNLHVFGYERYHAEAGRMVVLCNFSEDPQTVNAAILTDGNSNRPQAWRNVLDTSGVQMGYNGSGQTLTLAPYEAVWLLES